MKYLWKAIRIIFNFLFIIVGLIITINAIIILLNIFLKTSIIPFFLNPATLQNTFSINKIGLVSISDFIFCLLSLLIGFIILYSSTIILLEKVKFFLSNITIFKKKRFNPDHDEFTCSEIFPNITLKDALPKINSKK